MGRGKNLLFQSMVWDCPPRFAASVPCTPTETLCCERLQYKRAGRGGRCERSYKIFSAGNCGCTEIQWSSICDAMPTVSLDHPPLPLPYHPCFASLLCFHELHWRPPLTQHSPLWRPPAYMAQLLHPTFLPALKSECPSLPPQDFLPRKATYSDGTETGSWDMATIGITSLLSPTAKAEL